MLLLVKWKSKLTWIIKSVTDQDISSKSCSDSNVTNDSKMVDDLIDLKKLNILLSFLQFSCSLQLRSRNRSVLSYLFWQLFHVRIDEILRKLFRSFLLSGCVDVKDAKVGQQLGHARVIEKRLKCIFQTLEWFHRNIRVAKNFFCKDDFWDF